MSPALLQLIKGFTVVRDSRGVGDYSEQSIKATFLKLPLLLIIIFRINIATSYPCCPFLNFNLDRFKVIQSPIDFDQIRKAKGSARRDESYNSCFFARLLFDSRYCFSSALLSILQSITVCGQINAPCMQFSQCFIITNLI